MGVWGEASAIGQGPSCSLVGNNTTLGGVGLGLGLGTTLGWIASMQQHYFDHNLAMSCTTRALFFGLVALVIADAFGFVIFIDVQGLQHQWPRQALH